MVQRRLPGQKPPVQKASYVAAQTCKSGKAAVLTSLIQLPGDSASGRPAPGRTGVCLGTALVRVSKKSVKGKGKRVGVGGGGGGEGEKVGRRWWRYNKTEEEEEEK